jgi:rod shape-determining protein MreD
MLRVLRILLLLYLAVILQTTLAPAIAIYGVRPDFPFLVVLLVALREGAAGGAIAGFIAGLFVDMNSAQTFGVSSLVNSLVAFATGAMADRIVRDSPGARTAVAFLAVAVRDLCIATFALSDGFVHGLRLVVTFAIPGGVYSAAFAVAVMAISDRFIGYTKGARRAHR